MAEMKLSKENLKDLLMVGCVIGFIALGIGSHFADKARYTKIDAIMTGTIRGNKDSLVFHVPTCPGYSSIKEKNLREFVTVAEAEAANYRPSRNCLDEVATRTINETEIPEGSEGGHHDPRR